jgi:hypothetical protein
MQPSFGSEALIISHSHCMNRTILFITDLKKIREFVFKRHLPTPFIQPKACLHTIPNSHTSFLKYMCLNFKRSFHTGEFLLLLLSWVMPPDFIYFFLTMSCQIPFLDSTFHHHLQRRLMFIILRFFYP